MKQTGQGEFGTIERWTGIDWPCLWCHSLAHYTEACLIVPVRAERGNQP